MRRLLLVLALFAALFLDIATGPRAVAQDATPAAGDEELAGVTFEPVAISAGVTLPSPADLVLVRISIEPGASLPSDAGDPSLAVVLVEEGELTVELDAPIQITRSGAFATSIATAEAGGEFAAPEETIPAGETATLGVGDVGYFPPNIGGEIRNDGTEPAVGLAFIVEPSEGTGAEATPAA